MGNSNSGTTLNGGDRGGKALFSPFEVSKTLESPFNRFSPKSDQRQISPCNVNALQNRVVMRITDVNSL